MKKLFSKVLFAVLLLLMTGCEKSLLESENISMDDANVILHVSVYEQIPFGTRTVKDITQLCSRLNFAFFQDGTKVKTISQKKDDASFGTTALSLEEGTYQLVIIAHSSSGSATITSTEKVTFPSNLISDTFYYYGDLYVDNTQETYNLVLNRAVAMFRLELTNPLPDEAAKIRFYYTGGSSTFSPSAGYGCVNSRQTVMLDVAPQDQLEIYTFPHSETDELKILTTVYDANDNILKEKTFENVPITVNQITRYQGDFFGAGGGGGGGGGEPTSNGSFHLTAEEEWANEITYTF